MKRIIPAIFGLGLLGIFQPVQAELAIKTAPLKYQTQLEVGSVKFGYVDVSNPTKNRLRLVTEVQGFRQTGNQGQLEFFDDERIKAGIIPELNDFELGPREAVRLKFTVDANKLGEGGAYGALFARTIPAPSQPAGNEVRISARSGTLMILEIGKGGVKQGSINNVNLPSIIFGNELKGSFEYANVGVNPKSVAYSPKLSIKTGFFGKPKKYEGPLVMPKSARQIEFAQKGNHIGPIPITISDADNHAKSKTVWVFAVTGFWKWLVPLVLILELLAIIIIVKRRKKVSSS